MSDESFTIVADGLPHLVQLQFDAVSMTVNNVSSTSFVITDAGGNQIATAGGGAIATIAAIGSEFTARSVVTGIGVLNLVFSDTVLPSGGSLVGSGGNNVFFGRGVVTTPVFSRLPFSSAEVMVVNVGGVSVPLIVIGYGDAALTEAIPATITTLGVNQGFSFVLGPNSTLCLPPFFQLSLSGSSMNYLIVFS